MSWKELLFDAKEIIKNQKEMIELQSKMISDRDEIIALLEKQFLPLPASLKTIEECERKMLDVAKKIKNL